MGRNRKSGSLDVYVGSTRIGGYQRAANGSTTFRYDPAWLNSDRAFPISLSLPLSDRTWSGGVVENYFDGLLPDEQSTRGKIAARKQAESAGTFDLLSAIGRDCVGALRFLPEGADPGDPATMKYRDISLDEIAQRIANLESMPLGVDKDDELRLSIAGVQEKTAFLRINGNWKLPLEATPTSHIFKPAIKSGVTDFSHSPWNEYICLELCRELGLEAAQSDVMLLDDRPVLVVERFDRVWRNDVLYRLPQEDMCQAMGVAPSGKYQSDGGPGIARIMKLLNGAMSPKEDRIAFVRAQIVFWLLAAIDGHAKNFSIFLSPGGYKLTPLYDVISVAPYPDFSMHKTKLAMSFGDKGYYRIKQIQLRHFYQTAANAGLHKQTMDELFEDIFARIEKAVEKVSTLSEKVAVPESTYGKILSLVQNQAKLLQR